MVDFAAMVPEDFPRWKDSTCTHPIDEREPDGTGWVCMDCGVVAWR